jgi:hypothetical protein
MSEFRYHVPPEMTGAVELTLAGVKRMLERISLQEAPKDHAAAREHKMALAVAVNALCRGEWQR